MNRASYTDEITSIQALHTLTCLSSIMYCTVGCLVPYEIEVFGHNIEHVTAISPMKRQVRETAGRRQVHRALPRPGRNLLDALSTLLQQQLDQICWDPTRGDLSGSLCGWHVRPHACWERGRMSWFLWCGWYSKLPWSLVLWLQTIELSATCPIFWSLFLGCPIFWCPFFTVAKTIWSRLVIDRSRGKSQVWRFMKSWLECCAGQERVPEAPA